MKVDLARRAQIGQERRARTRAQLIEAANKLIARQAVESITIDDIVKEAGVAKGTFYVHFEDMHALVVAVADGLIEIFDELLQPQRQSLADPDWFIKLAHGAGDRIRLCEFTNYCEGLDQKHKAVTCQLWDKIDIKAPGVKLTADGKRRLTPPEWMQG